MPDRRALLRTLPAIDRLLGSRILSKLEETQPHLLILEAAQKVVDDLRRQLLDEQAPLPDLETEAVAELVAVRVALMAKPSLRKVINVTGTLLHTNLGRAPLCNEALQAIKNVAQGYSNLEYDLEAGKRGKRFTHVEDLICKLTGGEAATVVNNNAGAVMLALAALAGGQSAIVSRGELIEIGGSFRIPEVMQRSGSTLVEIGATNRTHLKDYQQAINPQTALLMKVHTSNYRVEGFTKSVSETELAELAHEHGLPFVIDLGSGSLVNFAALGLPDEPTAFDAIANGADIITFSGDKLLGGPQAGLIAGRRELITQIRQNPLKRALRLDKMTLAALAEVLKLYRHPESLTERLPTLRQLTRPLADIEAMARRLEKPLGAAVSSGYKVSIVPGFSQIGSGALPIETLPTSCLQLSPTKAGDEALRGLARTLRQLPVPIVGRLHNGTLLLDLRCLEDENLLLAALPALEAALA
jgi:L-seryl-tRNA(Ser) seleniumtransferase